MDVRLGTNVIDCCATKCMSYGASFVCIDCYSQGDVEWKRISVFDCGSAFGTLDHINAPAMASASNFTNLVGRWNSSALAAALFQESSRSSTNASFVLMAGCSEGRGCFVTRGGGASAFRQCSFVGNSVGAISHSSANVQDVLMFCYFINTNLTGNLFIGGSVLVDRCLFAGAVPAMPMSFILTGAQRSYTSTRISFDTASLLPTCGGIGGLSSRMVNKSHSGPGPYASSRLIVRMGFFCVFLALPL
jgi:hypothetical protein